MINMVVKTILWEKNRLDENFWKEIENFFNDHSDYKVVSYFKVRLTLIHNAKRYLAREDGIKDGHQINMIVPRFKMSIHAELEFLFSTRTILFWYSANVLIYSVGYEFGMLGGFFKGNGEEKEDMRTNI